MKTIKAYYFSNGKLLNGDCRIIKTGITHKVHGPPVLGEHGLHASRTLIDALKYAPGHIVHVVRMTGDIIESDDQLVATKRKYISSKNVEKQLRVFARKAALLNIKKMKPYCSNYDYDMVLEWLQTGNENVRSEAERASEYVVEYTALSVSVSMVKSFDKSAAAAAESIARSVAISMNRNWAEDMAWNAALYVANAALYSDDDMSVDGSTTWYKLNKLLMKELNIK